MRQRNRRRSRQTGSWVRELGPESDTQVADKVGVAAPSHSRDEGTATGEVITSIHIATGGASEAETLFFDAAVADEGAEDEGVGDGGGGEDFEGGEEGAELLVRVAGDGCGDAVDGYDDEDGGEAEEEGEGDFTVGCLVRW